MRGEVPGHMSNLETDKGGNASRQEEYETDADGGKNHRPQDCLNWRRAAAAKRKTEEYS